MSPCGVDFMYKKYFCNLTYSAEILPNLSSSTEHTLSDDNVIVDIQDGVMSLLTLSIGYHGQLHLPQDGWIDIVFDIFFER